MNRYDDLINIITTRLNEQIYFKQKGANKWCIYGLDTIGVEERFTQIDFRIEDKSLIISWLYLSESNTGCGSEVIKWFEEYCKKQELDKIEIRLVNRRNKEMIKFIEKFHFKKVNYDEEFINYLKYLI